MTFQVQLALANLPVQLLLLSSGHVAFTRVANFKTIWNLPPDDAVFTNEDFSIAGETFQYYTAYNHKEFPEMQKWILAQNLTQPILQHF